MRSSSLLPLLSLDDSSLLNRKKTMSSTSSFNSTHVKYFRLVLLFIMTLSTVHSATPVMNITATKPPPSATPVNSTGTLLSGCHSRYNDEKHKTETFTHHFEEPFQLEDIKDIIYPKLWRLDIMFLLANDSKILEQLELWYF
jgi:hypothetical protein